MMIFDKSNFDMLVLPRAAAERLVEGEAEVLRVYLYGLLHAEADPEAAAQELLARVRSAAREGGAGAVGARQDDLVAACSDGGGPSLTASMEGGQVSVHVESESGRRLDALLDVREDGSVGVASWRATTLWDEDTGDVLWTGLE